MGIGSRVKWLRFRRDLEALDYIFIAFRPDLLIPLDQCRREDRILELSFDAPITADPVEAPAIFHYLKSMA